MSWTLALFLVLAAVALAYFLHPYGDQEEDEEPDDGTGTEFTAEVARIANVRPHPNADKLEIADFELRKSGVTAYEVVVGKGDFKPGDLARYFSVDCMLPLSEPEFQFLKDPNHPDRTHHRLRAARLRGVFSQGLLVPARRGEEWGDRVEGVEYHRGPEERGPATPNAGAKKAKAQFAPAYSVCSLKKSPRLFRDDDTVLVTEKVDGCNIRFGWVKTGLFRRWKFRLGSHNAEVDPRGDSVWARAARLYLLDELTEDHKGLVFYGEIYGPNVPAGPDYGQLVVPGLVVFDVRPPSGQWLTAAARHELVNELGLPVPPILYQGAKAAMPPLDQMADGPSLLHAKTPREGAVVETWDTQGDHRKGKYVGQVHLMAKQEKQKVAEAKKQAHRDRTAADHATPKAGDGLTCSVGDVPAEGKS